MMKLRSTSLVLSALFLLPACSDSTSGVADGDDGGTGVATDAPTTMMTTTGRDDDSQGTESAGEGEEGDASAEDGTDTSAGETDDGSTTSDDTTAGTDATDDDSSTGEVPCTDDSECDNGIWCDGIETCNDDGVCEAGEAPCDDGVDCTDDACDEGDRSCTHTPNDAFCDNGVYCDGVETCDANDGCQPGEAVQCAEDNIECTTAECDEQSQDCVQVPDDTVCDNGVFCDGQETCDPVAGCQDGTPPDCDDGVACTIDSCSNELAACVNAADHSVCECGETCDVNLGCGDYCVVTECQGKVYECGDCIDNDGDCLVDLDDPNCWGPCDNNESGWKGEVPGQSGPSTCGKMDCYFDQDSGSGNDECYWAHTCDPEEPMYCTYNPNYSPSGTQLTCTELEQNQTQQCSDFCGPLTPNGCDCFGCCEVYLEGEEDPVTVFLGSETPSGDGTCNFEVADQPELCHPCTQVPACLNPCGECEICIGKDVVPDHCDEEDQCPGGEQPCGQDGQDPCQQGFFCLTGCCMPIPQ